ncbi:unnamed protein product [Adineta ricciae]|uniref:Phosphatidylcholine transfer protein n=1 Tax=Adineta ricciae TaxID=249248 RepID=A0A815PQF6_ADIRI|nr:unnamed protein product [Adineta ricciae]
MEPLWSIDELVQELDQPKLDGWKLFAQTSEVKVYRRIDEATKAIRYKCYSHIPDVTPEVFYRVALDIEYRLVWDKYLKEARVINDGEKEGIHWEIIMPLFIDNRDYTYVREYGEYDVDTRHFYYAMTRCEPFKNVPPKKKVVRIETCQTQTVLCSDGDKGLKSVFVYYEDPRGNIPKALWSWAAKFGVPMYVKLTHNACLNYPTWIKDKQAKLPNVPDEIDEIDRAATAEAAAIMASNEDVQNDNEEE